jgi:hypothetical protein
LSITRAVYSSPKLVRIRLPEGVAKAQDGAHDDLRVGVAIEVVDEGAIDLDLVEGEAAQVAERSFLLSRLGQHLPKSDPVVNVDTLFARSAIVGAHVAS